MMWLARTLVLIGALNWGLIGLFNFNLVAALFGPMSFISRTVYVLVGISGILMLLGLAGRQPARNQ